MRVNELDSVCFTTCKYVKRAHKISRSFNSDNVNKKEHNSNKKKFPNTLVTRQFIAKCCIVVVGVSI